MGTPLLTDTFLRAISPDMMQLAGFPSNTSPFMHMTHHKLCRPGLMLNYFFICPILSLLLGSAEARCLLPVPTCLLASLQVLLTLIIQTLPGERMLSPQLSVVRKAGLVTRAAFGQGASSREEVIANVDGICLVSGNGLKTRTGECILWQTSFSPMESWRGKSRSS